MKEREGIRFGLVSIINHWINAIIFISVMGLGFYLDYVGDGRAVRGPWMEAHKAGGVLLLILAMWRISWRFFQGFPKDLAPMPTWQKLSAKLVHWMLIFALVAMPVSGILLSLYSERGINVFGLFIIPPQPENVLVSGLASLVHESMAYLVAAALFMHVGAVFKHHLIDRDNTLVRMLKPNFKSYEPFNAAVETVAPKVAEKPVSIVVHETKIAPVEVVKVEPPKERIPLADRIASGAILTKVAPKVAPVKRPAKPERKV